MKRKTDQATKNAAIRQRLDSIGIELRSAKRNSPKWKKLMKELEKLLDDPIPERNEGLEEEWERDHRNKD